MASNPDYSSLLNFALLKFLLRLKQQIKLNPQRESINKQTTKFMSAKFQNFFVQLCHIEISENSELTVKIQMR